MRNKTIVVLSMMFLIPAVLFSVSCAKKMTEQQPAPVAEEAAPAKQPEMQDTENKPSEMAADQNKVSDADLERQRELQRREEQMASDKKQFVGDDIHFDFDSAALTPEAQQLLSEKADFLNKYTNITVTIEGNCDERGTEAYNLALGERRAEAVKAYLVNLGVGISRMATISYGEEKPIALGHNEEAWAKNRRAHFDID